jgi:predicted HD phosphohydrolase
MSEKADLSPLLRPDWKHLEPDELEGFGAEDWALLESQRAPYLAEQQAVQALALLGASAGAPTFGYRINNYRHCLQSATLAERDGQDEETVVVALFHDLGFIVCPENHGAFAAALLGPHISEANEWMLRHHAVFQQVHIHDHPACDPDEREQWRGHPFFNWTARFVERYDQNAIRPDYDTAPLAHFEPLVRRLFQRWPRRLR